MRCARLLMLYDKKDLTTLLKEQMTLDEAKEVVKGLRKLRMPSDFYNLLASALMSSNPDSYAERLYCFNPMLTQRLLECGETSKR